MIRPVTAEHFMFEEAIELFRPEYSKSPDSKPSSSYLLFDFPLNDKIETKYFTIKKSEVVNLSLVHKAYISKIEFKIASVTDFNFNSHLYALAVSSILSFILERPVKSIKDSYHMGKSLKKEDLQKYGTYFSILCAGPGSSHPPVLNKLKDLQNEVNEIIEKVYSLKYGKYKKIMQVFRVIQLAHINLKEDFGLAFSLQVASIEAVAQYAIKDNEVFVEKEDEELKWEIKSKNDKEFAELFYSFQDLKSKSKLKERFCIFIYKYCPPEDWGNMEHPDEFLTEINPSLKFLIDKKWFEKYFEDFTEDDLKNIVKDTYKYRCKFFHNGKQPPHDTPHSMCKFFDEQIVFTDKNKIEKKFLINYGLLSYIAHQSIRKYIQTI